MFSIVTGFEMVKVHDPDTLFAACAEAGIPFVEVSLGMVWADDGPYLRVEKTRRIRKVRQKASKGIPMDTPEARRLRVERLVAAYAAIPAAFDDRLTSDYSPLD